MQRAWLGGLVGATRTGRGTRATRRSWPFGRRVAVLVAVSLVAALALSACGGGGPAASGGAGSSTHGGTVSGGGTGSGSATGSGTASGAGEGEGYVVRHAMGETRIPRTPERVVVLTNEATEALLALGVKPVGAANSWLGDPWYDHIAPLMEGVTPVGKEDQPNLEAIAALQPDLILGTKMRHEKIYGQLSQIAPTVFSETIRGKWQENFMLWAEAVNRQAEGERLLEEWRGRIEDFRQKAGDKLDMEVSLVRFMPGRVRILYKDTFAGSILEEIGFKRPPAQDKADFAAEVGKERIPEMDGDILFYYSYETGDGQATSLEQEWTRDPLWKNLSVVKRGQVYKVDDVIWNTAGGILAANLMLDDLYRYVLGTEPPAR
ncbi:iron-siderophore ABC transporter substrate-binding protein [Thermaerobacter composti]|uniref:Iron-siderophore ABC transporter substrate-binding protein n=1 Tax=Thermaerobacter composti TaxID=554949 RepID=A0ABZ0QRU8_9FIRM|nr:iron-siderophore ABC transporter substrate-binding protein [Thermaerobacter composti]WPD20218.1 iron-siderophore ABC transporter substrate-binding protein [Thermaerobacter composti]